MLLSLSWFTCPLVPREVPPGDFLCLHSSGSAFPFKSSTAFFSTAGMGMPSKPAFSMMEMVSLTMLQQLIKLIWVHCDSPLSEMATYL